MSKTRVGILALQGDYAKHAQMVRQLGGDPVLVRSPVELLKCPGLIIPGGESTTMVKLLHKHELWEPLLKFGQERPVFGTCAGLILLARKLLHDYFQPLGFIDVVVQRNAYGSQIDSFIDDIKVIVLGQEKIVEGVFIRAPKIVELGKGVEILAFHKKDVVMVKQNNVMASSFHPELTNDTFIHQYFLNEIESAQTIRK
ncbi:pyridoxal 5'-phosphate synthase glutaminase subunit PdxT [candidate division KSB1 bacterium]|nr:pyridoxal 5'-phosphate synthase glutaminase subunit PdxT [candidate division KSB1 bacterium]